MLIASSVPLNLKSVGNAQEDISYKIVTVSSAMMPIVMTVLTTTRAVRPATMAFGLLPQPVRSARMQTVPDVTRNIVSAINVKLVSSLSTIIAPRVKMIYDFNTIS